MKLLFDLNILILLITFSFSFGLSLYIYFNNRKSVINKAFSVLLFFISLWISSFLFFLLTENTLLSFLAERMIIFSASFVASSLLYFTLIFPYPPQKIAYWDKFLTYYLGIIFACISLFTPFMVKGYSDVLVSGIRQPIFGPLFGLFSIYFALCFVLSVFNLFLSYFRSKGIEKIQTWYVLFGVVLWGATAIFTNILLPLLGVYHFLIVGVLSILLLAGFISYAIAKHNLLNIEDFLLKGILFLASVGAIVATLAVSISRNFVLLLPIYTIIAHLTLGFIVLLKNPRNIVNRSFALMVFSVVLWSLSNFFSDSQSSYLSALIWNKAIFAITAILPIFLALFSECFPTRSEIVGFRIKLVMIAIGILLAMLSFFTNMIVKEIHFVDWGTTISFGSLFFLHSLYVVVCVSYAFFNQTLKYFKFHGMYKEQIKYLLLGSFVSFVFAIATNIILPAFGVFRLTSFGPSFTLIFVGFVAYAIVRHRLMTLGIVIQKGLIYGVTAFSIIAIYTFLVPPLGHFLNDIFGGASIAIIALIVLLIAIFFQPLVEILQKATDQFFWRSRYDYKETLRKISNKITTQIRLGDLSKLIVLSFTKEIGVSECSLLLFNKDRRKYSSIPVNLNEEGYKKIDIDENAFVVNRLKKTKDVVYLDELELEISKITSFYEEDKAEVNGLLILKREISDLGGSLFVPILSGENLVGILFLGEKKSGDIFTAEDISLLMTLASQIAIALENAELYEEVLNVKNSVQDILDAMIAGVITVDNQGVIATFNPMAENITGIKGEDAIGQNYKEVFANKGNISQIIESAMQDKTFNSFESIFVGSDKHFIPVAISSTTLHNSHNKKTGILLTFTNLTEVKKLEEKVRQADKISALGTMAAGMAHEIKNPLSAMKIFAQLLPTRYAEKDFRQKLIDILPREINRIDKIVESLLGFARSTKPKLEMVDIRGLVDDIVFYFSDRAKDHSVKLLADIMDNLPKIEIDREQITQVISNLILNGMQAMTTGGVIGIKIYEGEKIGEMLHNIKIEISDSGHGITQDNLKKMFDPFFTTKHTGTGLGLAITHSIIDSHKGTIEVKSVLDKGTTFVITLPVSSSFKGVL